MTLQTVFGLLVILYSVANLASMGLELNLQETFTAFPNPDPRTLVMILLAGPVPALVALPLAKFFSSQAGKTIEAGAA